MIIRAAFLVCLLTVSYTVAYACINGITKELKSGYLIYEDEISNVPRGHDFYTDEDEFASAMKEFDSLFSTTKDFDYLSDKGILLIILGKYEKAIDLYLDIERQQPDRYSTAANLGTAYELAGQNENALKWIKKAVEIDGTSHSQSEWLHVKILEAKIGGENYYTTQFLLNTSFGDDKIPTSSKNIKELTALSSALYFQLNERMSFVEPKEKIVAQLLFDLGNVAFLMGEYKDALADYKLAQTYGFEGELINARISMANTYASKMLTMPPPAANSSYFGYILIAAAGIIIGGVFYKKWREDRS